MFNKKENNLESYIKKYSWLWENDSLLLNQQIKGKIK